MSLSKPELLTYAGIGTIAGLVIAYLLTPCEEESTKLGKGIVRDRETKKIGCPVVRRHASSIKIADDN